MAKIERFEEIASWRKGRELNRMIYEVSRKGEFGRDYGFRDQIRRASVSIMSNIAEGFERGGDKEFAQFLSNAKGSCGEVRAQLYVAFDAGYIGQEQFDKLYAMTVEISRTISGFMAYLSDSQLRGNKYKSR
jgi:four helix bundle protein